MTRRREDGKTGDEAPESAPVPDVPVPDVPVPDVPVPDATVPDATVPDATVPDAPKPPNYDEEIASIVAELMDERVKTKEREAAEAAARRARRLRRGLPLPAQITIIALVSALSIFPPAAFLPRRPAPTYTMSQGARVYVWIIANDIQRFRRVNGRLPNSLDEINRSGYGVVFEQTPDGVYTLTSRSPAFQWRSDQPLTRILSGVPNSLVPPRDGAP